LQEQGFDKELLSILTQTDENFFELLFDQNKDIASFFSDDELGEEYKKNKAKIDKIEGLLAKDTSITPEKRKKLQEELREGNNALLEYKQEKIKEKISIDPEVLTKNPKAMRAMINIIAKETKVERVQPDKDGVLNQIQNEIIQKFVLGKKAEHELLDLPEINNHLFSRKDFIELLNGIVNEDENMMKQEVADFFMNMRS
jgi:hypothetical protein